MAGNVLIKNANGNTITLQNPDTNFSDVVVDTSKVMQIIGNQTIDGIKTFTSSPVVPTPSTGDRSTKVATTAMFNNEFVTGFGYQKLPSGLIIQWGDTVVTTNGGGGGVFLYPIAFPNSTYMTMVSGGDNTTVTPFVRIHSQQSLTGCGFQTTAVNSTVMVTFIAIGY